MRITKVFVFITLWSTFASSVFGNSEEDFYANLKKLLSQEDVNASRLKAIIYLEKSGNPEAVSYLIGVLEDKSFPYRFAAIHALGSLGGDEAARFLQELWKDLENTKERVSMREEYDYIISQKAFVAAALYRLGNCKYIEFTYDLIQSDDRTLRYNAATALGMVKDKRSKEILYNVLKNDHMYLPRYGAAMALVELKDADIVNAIRDMVKEGELPPGLLTEVIEKLGDVNSLPAKPES